MNMRGPLSGGTPRLPRHPGGSENVRKPVQGNTKPDANMLQRTEASTKKFDAAFSGYSFKEKFFLLYMDKKDHHRGADAYDVKEPGYARGMRNGFSHLRKNIGVPLSEDPACTIDKLIAFHDRAVGGVKNDRGGKFQLGLGMDQTEPIQMDKVTPDALQYWKDENLIAEDMGSTPTVNGPLSLKGEYLGKDVTYPNYAMGKDAPPVRDQANAKLNKILEQFDASISQSESEDETLAAIADCLIKIEVSHFFQDGNQRTVAFLLANKFMIENGFGPVILDQPELFEGYRSAKEMVHELRKGMENYEAALPGNHVAAR